MSQNNPATGNNTGLPALLRHISDVQDKKLRLSGVMNAVAYLENEEACPDGQAALIFLADEMAAEINNALDRANLPKVAS